jgi:protein-L-isoaspartate(D-aspartate) O-methyltransferase
VTIDECRRIYAEEIRSTAKIRSPTLVEAFARVPREKFLGSGPWEIARADDRGVSSLGTMLVSDTRADDPRNLYHDVIVALDKAHDINNGQPSALARWIDALDLKAGDRTYHLGCGVGYYTAIMAEVVGAGASVAAVEIRPDLAKRAKENLSCYPNVTVHAGDGAAFDPGACNAVLINAGVTHPIPLWLDRLCNGGRMVVPLTMATTPTLGIGVMTKIVRERGGLSAQMVTSVAIYSCRNVRDTQREPLLKAAMTSGALMNLKSVRRDAHEEAETCVIHGRDVCLSNARIG